MKISFFNTEDFEKKLFEKEFSKDDLFFSQGKFTSKEVQKQNDVEILSIFIHSAITANHLAKLSKLKLICTMSTGFDHIDLEACKKRGIAVCNVPTYGENTVAEQTFALLLALSRKIVDSVNRTREDNYGVEKLRGFDLKGKILGIVGCGNIGQNVVKIAKGFGMIPQVFDVQQNFQLAKDLDFSYVSLDKLLSTSDIVTLHVPYNKATHHLINKKTITKMKKGAYLINTSRGGVVDTDALIKGLLSKKIAGCGLDVLEEEKDLFNSAKVLRRDFSKEVNVQTLVENHVLHTLPNVLITPHNAFNTTEALERIVKTTIENIQAFKKGKMINRVA